MKLPDGQKLDVSGRDPEMMEYSIVSKHGNQPLPSIGHAINPLTLPHALNCLDSSSYRAVPNAIIYYLETTRLTLTDDSTVRKQHSFKRPFNYRLSFQIKD